MLDIYIYIYIFFFFKKTAKLVGLNASISSINLYLYIHLVFKNYNIINIR